jgi:hypothetical protein
MGQAKVSQAVWHSLRSGVSATPIGSESNYTEGELATALRNYEAFHRLPIGRATVEQLQSSSAKIGGWLRARLEG